MKQSHRDIPGEYDEKYTRSEERQVHFDGCTAVNVPKLEG
jgi:hypothetical protein